MIRDKVTLAGIAEVLGSTEEENVQGEVVKVLDVLSNQIMKRRLLTSGLVCMVVSEEDEEPCLPKVCLSVISGINISGKIRWWKICRCC